MKNGRLYAAALCLVVAGGLAAFLLASGGGTMLPTHPGTAAQTAMQKTGLPIYVPPPQTVIVPHVMAPEAARTLGLPSYYGGTR